MVWSMCLQERARMLQCIIMILTSKQCFFFSDTSNDDILIRDTRTIRKQKEQQVIFQEYAADSKFNLNVRMHHIQFRFTLCCKFIWCSYLYLFIYFVLLFDYFHKWLLSLFNIWILTFFFKTSDSLVNTCHHNRPIFYNTMEFYIWKSIMICFVYTYKLRLIYWYWMVL